MAPSHSPSRPAAAAARARLDAAVPSRLLIACGPFAWRLDATAVARALARGLTAAGAPGPDVLTLGAPSRTAAQAKEMLAEEHFDRRMLASRALVLVLARLERKGLAGSLTLELATRARQSGVPAYAVAAENELDAFDARVLDLQVVLRAGDARGLTRAGRKLAGLV